MRSKGGVRAVGGFRAKHFGFKVEYLSDRGT